MHLQNAIQNAAIWLGPWAMLGVFLALFLQTANPIGVLVPGNPLVFGLGLLARTSERFSLAEVVLAMAIGAVGGTLFGVWTGRKAGPAIFTKPRFQPWRARSEAFFEKYGQRAIGFAFFVPFLRCFVPVFAGVSGVQLRSVLLPAIIGGIAWTGLFASAGYGLGLVPGVRQNLDFAVIGLLVVGIAGLAIKKRRTVQQG